MRSEQMVASEWPNFAERVTRSIQLLPFYETHTLARQVFSKKVRENSGTGYVIYKGKTPYLFMTVEAGRVTNLLMQENLKNSWTAIFLAIERLFKQTFQPKITFLFPQSLTLHLQEVFLNYGYVVESNRVVVKELQYHTSLILGGGGARGAYQIGVWQALKELEIPIKIITGTSVGALNGALILQDDFEAAKNMWEKIETNQILSFPTPDVTSDTLGGMMSQIGLFTLSAIQSKGVSTKPLQKLIHDTFSKERIQQVTADFYLVTTELPTMQEKNIHFNDCHSDQWQRWLLASASFFPAMAATKIADNYYIDGGYRNNIPVDIALRKGATECIIVDVKGPGITKPVKIPATTSCLTLQTPWSMGAVLLFDGVRSTQNIQLGYLETIKAIRRNYFGYWYTVDETIARLENFQQDFFTFIKETYQIKLWTSLEQQNKICKKLRKVYKDRVYTENIGLVLVELLAKSQEISASKLYTIQELAEMLQKTGQMKTDFIESRGMISVQEWLLRYYEDYFLLSDKQQLSLMNNLLNADEKEKTQRVIFLLDKLPAQVLQILMKEFILKGADEE
ncbi:patatin-like phospholipase family protein [Enterococcus ureilyticus]|uniref:patatin-like phospholipase family protein n=1 Tax=Enterococcus ureilyticus TaxID=1131292 RepID=UPI001A91EF24|nr:patatin-like phospholipase family protein [Enterococcus ureilyticus]MBO0447590.1 patatin-like phospholipase family protein [Enterococcus ureilyticus]